MIEALVHYIRSKGYTVTILPERLYIWKLIGGQKLTLCWAMTKAEIASMSEDLLFSIADEKLIEFTYAENAAMREIRS